MNSFFFHNNYSILKKYKYQQLLCNDYTLIFSENYNNKSIMLKIDYCNFLKKMETFLFQDDID